MKRRIYFVVVVIGLAILALKLQSFVRSGAPEIQEPKEIAVAEPEYNPAVEIENTLTQFDSLLEQNLKESGTVGAAAVITYKGKIALVKCYGVRKAGEKNPVD
ncbi:hypothetical protein SLH46_14810 [Draconibacterium sp. IB214405]|uniref:hypothetical protein n=1 Tax=Draconibacterium sp. IB214405 TaxID=3097352 RepID=UPI002A1637B7|nr:hypothetical protein [Draconibacterium sp. IB214405]MDX8340471.1 hypothetical protein [Draconibacterium sp. IB214405]